MRSWKSGKPFRPNGDVGLTAVDQEAASFDLVLATGVLHHLDDSQAVRLFDLARRALKPGARLFTYDGCFVAGQPKLARFVVSQDRGKYVRESAEYAKLAAQVFPHVRSFVRHDLLRIPYTHVILQCGNSGTVPSGCHPPRLSATQLPSVTDSL